MRLITILFASALMWSAAAFVLTMPQTASANSEEIDGMDAAYLSARLANMGREERDPFLLIAAARVLARVNTTTASLTAEIEGGAADASPGLSATTPASLLDEARAMASGDAATLAVIEQSKSVAGSRGAGGGPKAHQQLVARGARATFRADFRGREPAQVVVVGSHSANLDLVILDANRRVVCVSRSPFDYEVCRWHPAVNASFWLVVENRGDRSSLFSIYTN